jgi:hypothetical protein
MPAPFYPEQQDWLEKLNNLFSVSSTYYGPLAADPSTRPDGSARQVGDRYFNAVALQERTWNGSVWYVPNVNASQMAAAGGGELVGNTPAGNIAATTVQAAINELDAEKAKLNGDSTQNFSMSSLNGGPLAGLRNRAINGSMRVAQQGSIAITPNAVIYGGCDMTAAFVTAATVTGGSIAQAPNAAMYSGLAQTVGPLSGTGVTRVLFLHRIESRNVQDLNGKTITVSFTIYHDTGLTVTPTISISKANSLDNFSGTTGISGSALSTLASGVSTRYSFTATLGATDANNGLQVQVELAHASASVSAKNYQIGDLRIEPGSAASQPWVELPVGLELVLCERYYQLLGGARITGQVNNGSNTVILISGAYRTRMRAAPTHTLLKTSYSAGSFELLVGGAWVSNASATLGAATPSADFTGFVSTLTGFSGLAPGQLATFNVPAAVIAASAQL